MKVNIRISVDGRTGVSRKTYDEIPAREAVLAQLEDAMSQTLENWGEAPKKKKKVTKKPIK